MSRLGAEIVDPAEIETAGELGEPEMEVLLYEFKADLNAYLSRLGPEVAVHSLAEVIAFNEAHRERVMPYFGQERMLAAQEKGPLTDRCLPGGAGGQPPPGARRRASTPRWPSTTWTPSSPPRARRPA